MRQRWIFIGRDRRGWLGFRCVEGPGSVLSEVWVGDLYIEPGHYWRADR